MIHEISQTPRARRHDANEARILEAAMALVAEGGLEALSMAKLAAAADYTPGALYRYFDSKDALLAALVGQLVGEVEAALGAATAALPKGASPLTRLFALAFAYRRYAQERPHGFGLLAVTIAEPRVLLPEVAHAAPITARVLATLEHLAQALGDAVEAGQLAPGDVAERTLGLFATLQGHLQLGKLGRLAPVKFDVGALVAAAVRALLVGWGATPRAVAAAEKKASLPHPGVS